MYVWNYYGNVLVVGVVVGSIIVDVINWLNVHGTWFNIGFVFVFKLLLQPV